MKKRKKISLSSEQTVILASLLNYNHIFAVDDMALYDVNDSFTLRIRGVLSDLEESKIISYDFNGTLKLSVDIKKVIDAICTPDSIVVLDGTIGVKKRQTEYLMIHEEDIVILHKNGDRNDYYIYSRNELDALISGKFTLSEVQEIHEVIDRNIFAQFREKILSFQHEEAAQIMGSVVKEQSSVDVIADYILKKNHYLRIQIYKRNNIYKIIGDYFIFDNKGSVIRLSKDSDNYYFDTISIQSIVDEISRNICGE